MEKSKCMIKVEQCYNNITKIMRVEVANPREFAEIFNELIKLYRSGTLEGFNNVKCGDILPPYIEVKD